MIWFRPAAFFYDTLAFLSCARAGRLLNGVQLAATYLLSRLTGRYFFSGRPMALNAETFAGCNLHCPECPAGTGDRTGGAMPLALYQKALDELDRSLCYTAFHFLGEPLLHPSIWKMVRSATARGIYTELHTNGQRLMDFSPGEVIGSGLNRLRLSVDGATQSTYAAYRAGGDLNRVVESTAWVAEERRRSGSHKPLILWQCIVFRHNEHEMEQMNRLAKAAGADALVFKSAWLQDETDPQGVLPHSDCWRRKARQRRKAACWRSWHAAVLTVEGRVLPCCYDKQMQFSAGMLQEATLPDIWRSGSMAGFRRGLMKGEMPPMCRQCAG